MMRRRIVLTAMMIATCSAYIAGQNYVSLTLSADTITPGDPFTVVWTVSKSGSFSGTIDFGTLDTIPNLLYERDTVNFSQYADYDILSGGANAISENRKQIDLGRLAFSGNKYSDSLQLTIYDVGIFAIAPPELVSSENSIPTQPAIITVVLPQEIQAALQDSVQIAPLKPIMQEPTTLEDFRYFFLALGILLLSILLIWYTRKRRKRIQEEAPEEIIIIPAHITAFEKLDTLKSKELWQRGLIKEYQTELTFVIREYLENRYHFNALEMTTGEILKDIPEEVDQEKLKQILQIADLVKFAKANPPEDIHGKFMDIAYNLVEETKEVEVTDD